MFKVRDEKWNIFVVYAAREYKKRMNETGTLFLMFLNRQNKWVWIDSDSFIPYVESDTAE